MPPRRAPLSTAGAEDDLSLLLADAAIVNRKGFSRTTARVRFTGRGSCHDDEARGERGHAHSCSWSWKINGKVGHKIGSFKRSSLSCRN